MDRLPPLNGLRAFEAAARHLSVTRAATELNVTPGAVSRQIRALEAFVGTQLFARGYREITLTSKGADYFKGVTHAIEQLRKSTQRLTGEDDRRQLKVRAYTTFAMRWLIPHLSSFHSAYPKVDVMLTTSLDPVDFTKEDLDCAIRLGAGAWRGVKVDRLVSNIIVPVCSPQLLKPAQKLRRPGDLAKYALLHAMGRADDWKHWLDAAGAAHEVDVGTGMTYESSAMAYSAALEGHGIAMAQYFLVEDDLREGRLVRPLPQTVDMGHYTYYLLTPAGRRESASMKLFRNWLLKEFSNAQPFQGCAGASCTTLLAPRKSRL